MNRLLRILPATLVLISISAFADSITYTNLNVSFNVSPNDGSGGNMGGRISGPGVNLLAGGGTPFSWFNDIEGVAPGSVGGGGTTIFFEDAFGTIGSQSYQGGDLGLGEVSFDAGSFTFPTNGKDFTVTVPASIGLINGTIFTQCGENGCPTFTLATNSGELTLSFFYANGLYYGSSGSFTTTPEPGTLGLVAIGLGAVTWFRCKQTQATRADCLSPAKVSHDTIA